MLLLHATHVRTISTANIATEPSHRHVDQLQAFSRFQFILLGQEHPISRYGPRNLPILPTTSGWEHLEAGLPDHPQQVEDCVAFGDLAVLHHVELTEPDVRLIAGGRDIQPVLGERAGEVAGGGHPIFAVALSPHEDVGVSLQIGERLQQWLIEVRDERFNALQLIDGMRGVPVDVLVDGRSDQVCDAIGFNVVHSLPEVPHSFFVHLIVLARHCSLLFTERYSLPNRRAQGAVDSNPLLGHFS